MENRFLFRGKRTDTGEWVQGFYCKWLKGKRVITYSEKETDCIITWMSNGGMSRYEVDPSTICQCTGLKDKNGNLIWENDIVKDEHGNLYKAFWQNNYYQFSWICVKSDVFSIGAKWDLWSFKSFEIEVIGNVFDNPELLEVQE